MDESRQDKITQRRFLWGRLDLEIRDKLLAVTWRKGLSRTEFQVPLAEMDPAAVRHQHTSVGPIILAAICFVPTSIFLVWTVLVWGRDPELVVGLGFVTLICLAITLAALGIARKERRNLVSFYGSDGAIQLWHNLPDSVTFDRFLARLQGAIRDARGSGGSDVRAVLRRLLDFGILNDWEYREALHLFELEE